MPRKIAVGQKWRWVSDDGAFYTKGREYEVLTVPDDGSMFTMQDDTHFNSDMRQGHHWSDDGDFRNWFEPVGSPVETVTVKRIVPGTYGLVEVDNTHIEGVSLWLPRNRRYTRAELTELAATLTEIAEAIPA